MVELDVPGKQYHLTLYCDVEDTKDLSGFVSAADYPGQNLIKAG
jgi:hypothetical protein